MRNAPTYNDGILDVYREATLPIGDYSKPILVSQGMRIWYEEMAIYDRTRAALEETGKEVTMKVRIPQYRSIDSHCWVKIEGRMHRVYNAAHAFDKDGFAMTELTLIKPENELEEAQEI